MFKHNKKLLFISFILIFSCIFVQSCKKPDDSINRVISSCTIPPAPIAMVPLNKQGTSLLTSATDQVVISYSDNGQTQVVPCTVGTLQDAATRQPSTKYNALAVYCNLGVLSNRKNNPTVKTFQLTVNGQPAGTIFYDLQDNPNRTSTGVQDCFKLVSFQLNAVPVQTDVTVMPNAAILNCNL
jgi:hypothetical protein